MISTPNSKVNVDLSFKEGKKLTSNESISNNYQKELLSQKNWKNDTSSYQYSKVMNDNSEIESLDLNLDSDSQSNIIDNSFKIYEVKSGDSLSKIAQENNTTVEELIKNNNIDKNGHIKEGQQIKIFQNDIRDSNSNTIQNNSANNDISNGNTSSINNSSSLSNGKSDLSGINSQSSQSGINNKSSQSGVNNKSSQSGVNNKSSQSGVNSSLNSGEKFSLNENEQKNIEVKQYKIPDTNVETSELDMDEKELYDYYVQVMKNVLSQHEIQLEENATSFEIIVSFGKFLSDTSSSDLSEEEVQKFSGLYNSVLEEQIILLQNDKEVFSDYVNYLNVSKKEQEELYSEFEKGNGISAMSYSEIAKVNSQIEKIEKENKELNKELSKYSNGDFKYYAEVLYKQESEINKKLTENKKKLSELKQQRYNLQQQYNKSLYNYLIDLRDSKDYKELIKLEGTIQVEKLDLSTPEGSSKLTEFPLEELKSAILSRGYVYLQNDPEFADYNITESNCIEIIETLYQDDEFVKAVLGDEKTKSREAFINKCFGNATDIQSEFNKVLRVYSYMSDDQVNDYLYLLKKKGEGSERALNYIYALEDDANKYYGEIRAKEELEKIISKKTTVEEVLSSFGISTKDGMEGAFNNLFITFTGDTTTTVQQYASQYFLQILELSSMFTELDENDIQELVNDKDNPLDTTIAEYLKTLDHPTGLDIMLKNGQITEEDYKFYLSLKEKEPYKQYIEELSNKSGVGKAGIKYAYNTGLNVGNMLPSIAASAIFSFAGLASVGQNVASMIMFGGAYGSAYQQGIQSGKDMSDAVMYAMISASSEVLTEKFLGRTPGISNAKKFVEASTETIYTSGKEVVIGTLKTVAADLFCEVTEEELQNIIERIDDGLTGGTFDFSGIKEESVDTAVVTVLSTLILGSATNAINLGNNYTNMKDFNKGKFSIKLEDGTVVPMTMDYLTKNNIVNTETKEINLEKLHEYFNECKNAKITSVEKLETSDIRKIINQKLQERGINKEFSDITLRGYEENVSVYGKEIADLIEQYFQIVSPNTTTAKAQSKDNISVLQTKKNSIEDSISQKLQERGIDKKFSDITLRGYDLNNKTRTQKIISNVSKKLKGSISNLKAGITDINSSISNVSKDVKESTLSFFEKLSQSKQVSKEIAEVMSSYNVSKEIAKIIVDEVAAGHGITTEIAQQMNKNNVSFEVAEIMVNYKLSKEVAKIIVDEVAAGHEITINGEKIKFSTKKEQSKNDTIIEQKSELGIKSIKKEILTSLPTGLSAIEKARYLYIELNKRLNYDLEYQDFYYSNNEIDKIKAQEIYNKNLSFDNLVSDRVICKGWSQLYMELLLSAGFNKEDIRLMGKEKNGDHRWVEIKIGDEIISADATNPIAGATDLGNSKFGNALYGFILIPKEMSGKGPIKIYESNPSNYKNYCEKNFINTDKNIGYSDGNGYYSELLQKAQSLFGNQTVNNDVDQQFNAIKTMKINKEVDGVELYSYLKNKMGLNKYTEISVRLDDRKFEGVYFPCCIVSNSRTGETIEYIKGIGFTNTLENQSTSQNNKIQINLKDLIKNKIKEYSNSTLINSFSNVVKTDIIDKATDLVLEKGYEISFAYNVAEIMVNNNVSSEIAEIMLNYNVSSEIAEIMINDKVSKEVAKIIVDEVAAGHGITLEIAKQMNENKVSFEVAEIMVNYKVSKEVAGIMVNYKVSKEVAEIMANYKVSKEIAGIMVNYKVSKEVAQIMLYNNVSIEVAKEVVKLTDYLNSNPFINLKTVANSSYFKSLGLTYNYSLPQVIKNVLKLQFTNEYESFFLNNCSANYGADQDISAKYARLIVKNLDWLTNKKDFLNYLINQCNCNKQTAKELLNYIKKSYNKTKSVTLNASFGSRCLEYVFDKCIKENRFDVIDIFDKSFILDKRNEFNRLISKLNKSGMNTLDAIRTLCAINTTGVCSYAAVANSILNAYRENPKAFERDFGYPMYIEIDGKKELNSSELILDMYTYLNSNKYDSYDKNEFIFDNNGKNMFTYDSNGKIQVNNLRTKSQVYLSTNWQQNDNAINSFLESKNVHLKLNSNFAFNSKGQSGFVETIFKYLSANQNNSVNLGIFKSEIPIRLMENEYKVYVTTDNWKEGDGHAVCVTGIIEDYIVVSSWGKRLLIPISDLINNNFTIAFNQLEGIK